ncbi:adhesion G protein-coupled receptor L4-like [Montipora capricornis]|uniref:adhesion G protein-coupled receptor L4-like n=1 Tax=Montipora capricornis TaxID=246305 RepID=UPI0035F1F217
MAIGYFGMRILSVWLVFVESVLCSRGTENYDEDFCVGKTDGMHADPMDCRTYYDCVGGNTYHRTGLAVGLMLDSTKREFRHSNEVNCTIKKVYRELWTGVSGDAVADLESSDRFPCAPTETKFIDTFCIYNPSNRDYYGQRLKSFFRAPETGNYRFQTSCDDVCQLWISDNEQSSRKRLIINQKHSTEKFRFSRNTDQSSEEINLAKGKLYYMELLHKEKTDADFMCVSAKFPTLKGERPLSSRHFVMNDTELNLIGCYRIGAFFDNIKCIPQFCHSPQQKLKTFKNFMGNLTKRLILMPSGQSASLQRQITEISKEGTRTINEVLEDTKKHQWRQSNFSLAIQIAKVTELFGIELSRKWANDTTILLSLQSNVVLQVASLESAEYRFSGPKENENWNEISDFLYVKLLDAGKDFRTKVKSFSVIYKSLHKMLPSTLDKIATETGNEHGRFYLNSRIIGSLITPHVENGKIDTVVTLQHVKHKSNSTLVPVCGWWDFKVGGVNGSGMWSRKGCSFVASSSNATHSICKCNHLTNFAILMKVSTENDQLTESHHVVALEIITYVGCGLSLTGILITVVIISCLSGLRSEKNLIHLNLSVAIGIFQIIFLAGIEATSNKIICTIVAVWLHYFLLVWFAWMLIEGIHLYLMVITVFEDSKDHLRLYGACAYGLPGIIVLIAASVAHEGYGTESSCWLSVANGVIYAFVVPALLIILVNTVILGMVIREIIRIQTNGVPSSTKLNLIKSGIKSVIVLFPLLGITWIFGVLALGKKTIAFQYLFALCNSLQGFFIFVFHCLCNSEIRRVIQRKREIWTSRKSVLLFWSSSMPASATKSASSKQSATSSDAKVRPLSEDTQNSEPACATNADQVKSSRQSKEKSTAHKQSDITPNKERNNLQQAQPAWLNESTVQGSSKVKLPPVSSITTNKKKHKRNSRDRKGKLDSTIESVKEEITEKSA